MPEGDSIHQAAERLRAALAGHALTRADLRVPRYATTRLDGRIVTDVVPRGKHLLIRLEGVTLHSHLRLDGSWRLFRRGDRWRGPSHQIRAVLEVEAGSAVGYRLHDLRLVRPADEGLLVGHLGPDPLGPDWDPELAVHNLGKEPDRPIAEALLDQRALAGIGNVFKAETLFLGGTHPWRPAGRSDLPGLVEIAARLMEANRKTAPRNTTGSPHDPLWVYGRSGSPCLRCGKPVSGADQGGRVTYWCAECQR
ncbi:Fpg/Nei family DNA glycosylase [Actinocorallia lasiicapitis]